MRINKLLLIASVFLLGANLYPQISFAEIKDVTLAATPALQVFTETSVEGDIFHNNSWGYDLTPYKTIGTPSVYKTNSDFVFIHTIEHKTASNEGVYLKTNFFKKTIIKITAEEFNKIGEVNKFLSLIDYSINYKQKKLTFKDGSFVEFLRHDANSSLCSYPDLYASITLKGNNGEIKAKKAMFILKPTINTTDVSHQECDGSGIGVSPIQYKALETFPDYIIPLEDETFIAFSNSGNIIVRFDMNLNTKFISPNILGTEQSIGGVGKNFFILDYDVIEKIKQKIKSYKLLLPSGDTVVDQQLIHDLILKELFSNQSQKQ